ncbi:MAG: adenylate/guanylate cyclase domain-containing protein [Geminicoccaceae bacterium]
MPTRPPLRVALGTALAGLVLLLVLLTAALIHLPWSVAARRNVTEVAERLNGEIVDSVRRELTGLLGNTAALAEALRSILAQGAISPDDEADREFIFLALLRSQVAVSRLSFGWPDGRYFGAGKVDDEHIRMSEVRDGQLRTDDYAVEPGDAIFLERRFAPSSFSVAGLSWFAAATEPGEPVWVASHDFPDSSEPSVTVATRLVQYGRYLGVVGATVALTRLSSFLATLEIGTSGTVVVLDPDGVIVASADPAEIAEAEAGRMRRLADFAGGGEPRFAAIATAIAEGGIDLHRPPPTLLMRTTAGGEGYFVNLARLGFQGWVVATAIPERDFLGNIERNTRLLLVMLGVFTAIVAGVAVLLAHRLIVRPLRQVAGQLRHVEAFEPERMRQVPSRLRELDGLSTALMQMGQGLGSFRKYVPAELVRTLLAQGVPAKPDLDARELTVLFTDLAGFTALTEKLGEDVVPLLSRYLELATLAVVEHRGTVDKFIGDAVMAFWGAPLPHPAHALDACRAALAIRDRLAMARAAFGDAASGLEVRIGINTGSMLVGNIGSDERLSYTAIGDAVNVASRLESLNKLYGTRIIVGEATRHACGPGIVVRELDAVAVYGRRQPTVIYELLGMADASAAPAWVALYAAGLGSLRARRWDEAIRDFAAVLEAAPDDGPARLMLERATAWRLAPPPADWQGAVVLDSK